VLVVSGCVVCSLIWECSNIPGNVGPHGPLFHQLEAVAIVVETSK
jgi:hypothetical protein